MYSFTNFYDNVNFLSSYVTRLFAINVYYYLQIYICKHFKEEYELILNYFVIMEKQLLELFFPSLA